MSEDFLTSQGLKKLKDELNILIKVRRPEVALRLKEAVALGDLSENAEYAEAKEEQAFVEGRVNEIEEVLRKSEIVDDEIRSESSVYIGCAVHLSSGTQVKTFTLVGKTEANPDNGEISADSPLGKAILGRARGEMINVHTQAGNKRYKIIKIA